MEKFIVAGGTAVRYFDQGCGEKAVLLLHGYLESIEVWEDFAAGLSERFRVVGLDLPGHGISEVTGPVHSMEYLASVAADLLKQCGVDRCVVVGHSMGGYVAQAFAVAYPEMTAGLVLLHSTPGADTPERKEHRRREIELIRAGKKEALAHVLPGKGFAPGNRKRFAELIEGLSEQVALTEDEGILALLNGMMQRRDLNDALRALDRPQLFVFGKQDEYIPVEAAQAVAAAHPKAEVLWLEHSGHMGFVEEEALVLIVVSGFIERCFSGKDL